jgi:GT2 family glycosyltransferase
MISIAVLLVHYNNVQVTWECIQNLATSEYDNFCIIIVDNSNQVKDFDFIKYRCTESNFSFQFLENSKENINFNQSIYWYQAPENLGYAGGMNLGAEIALSSSPDSLLFLNNDIFIVPDFLTRFLAAVKPVMYQPKFGIATCQIKTWPEKKIWYSGGSFNRVRCMGEHRLSKPQNMKIQETGFISGCCMLCRPEVYQILGGMDESFFLYFEDVDFCYRAVQKGYKLFYAPQVELYHKVGSSTGGDETELSSYYSSRNRIRLMRKHFTGFILYRFYCFFFFNRLVKALKWGLSGRSSLVAALWRGIKEGLVNVK